MTNERKKQLVIFDPGQVEKMLGREMTDDESLAAAIFIDAQACGRTIAETAINFERGGGTLSRKSKQILGLEPPSMVIIPSPPDNPENN